MKLINYNKFFIISRPILFPLILICLLCALFFSISQFSEILLNHLIFVILLTFLVPFFTFSINDLEDYHSDKINPRKKSILFGKFIPNIRLYKSSINLYNFLIFLLLFLYTIVFYSLETILILIILIFLLYFYSAKPFRLKEVFLLDLLSNGLIALLTFSLIFSLFNNIFALPIGILFFSLSISSYHLIAAQLDISSDKKTKQKTTATKINNRHVVYFICVLLNLPLLFFKINSFFKYLFYVNILIILIIYFFPRFKKIYLFLFFIISWMVIALSYVWDFLF